LRGFYFELFALCDSIRMNLNTKTQLFMRILKALAYFFSFKWLNNTPTVEVEQPEASEGLWSSPEIEVDAT